MKRFALVAACALAVGCWSVPEPERREVTAWLLCVHCGEPELTRLLSMGPRAERYLRAAIIDGPTRTDDSLVARQAVEVVLRAHRYRRDRGHMVPVSSADSSETIQRQVDDFRLRYRLRAAHALARLDAAADSAAIRTMCDSDPPELARRPEYREQFRLYGPCP